MLNLLAEAVPLAQGGAPAPPAPRNDFGDTLGDGPAGPLALLIVVLLAIATIFLIRNMNSRLRRLPAEFPAPAGSGPATGGSASTSAVDDHRPGGVGRGGVGSLSDRSVVEGDGGTASSSNDTGGG